MLERKEIDIGLADLSLTFPRIKVTKIRFEWADIIYDMSKARHLNWSVGLISFYLIRQPAL